MGRGFGRGAKSVAIVTHAQVKEAGRRKVPKGLRGTRQKKRKRYENKNDNQRQLEESLGLHTSPSSSQINKGTLAEEIASIQFPYVVNKRRSKLGGLRRQIIHAVKNIRRRHSDKGKRKISKKIKN